MENREDTILTKLKTNGIQFVKFGLVGVGNTVISYVIYYILVKLEMHYMIASIMGFIVSVINSFYWNNRYVFKLHKNEKRSIFRTFFKTFLSYAGSGLILANVLLYLWIDVFGISKIVAPVINLVITVPLNYILNKYWAFNGHFKV